MAALKKLRTALAVIAAVALVCAFALPFAAKVNADVVTKAKVEAYYAENADAIEKAGLTGDYDEAYNAGKTLMELDEQNAGLVYEQLSLYVDCAGKKNSIRENYSDEKVDSLYLGKNRTKIKSLRDGALSSLVVKKSDLVTLEKIAAAKENLQAIAVKFAEDVEKVATTYETEFSKYKENVVAQYDSVYNSLKAETATFLADKEEADKSVYDGQSLNSTGYYTAANFAALTEAYQSGSERLAEYTYDTQPELTLSQKEDEIEKIKREVIEILKTLPHNDFEVCYDAYNDYRIAYYDEEITPDALAAYESDFLSKWNAINADGLNGTEEGYWVKLDESIDAQKKVKQSYLGKYSAMSKFIQMNTGYDPFSQIDYRQISELTDETGVITVTAYFLNEDGSYLTDENGEKVAANVFTNACRVKTYDVANGALKRNASTAIREIDKKMGASYFISVSVYKGHKEYTFVKESEDGSPKTAHWLVANKDEEGNVTGYTDKGAYAVTYEVTVDLASYCEKFGTFQKDKFENVKKGNARINELGEKEPELSLAYGYSQGKVEKLSYTLDEGGKKIVFTTTHFSTFCIAGLEIQSLITNPLFWVIVLAALILIIIIIRLIVKNVKYTIRFVTNGGSPVAPVKAAKNEYFVMPAAPVKDGFVFAGWFTDKECTVRFIETHMRRRKGYKLYAKWAAPVSCERLAEFYDGLRDLMQSYEKKSFKPVMGLVEKERLAFITGGKTHVSLYLALNAEKVKKEGYPIEVIKDKKHADIPAKIVVSTEETYARALELTRRTLLEKGLQPKTEFEPAAPSTADERAEGFEYCVVNERVAKTAEDYFELLRIALKSYVLEADNGKFKDGEKRTFARVYINNEVACLYLNSVKTVKGLAKGESSPRFEDTPVLFKVLTAKDLLEAYELIDKMMTSYGFVKCPENANDLKDVTVPTTNGFAYTIKF